ncbi:MAG TPA: OmpA family protein [Polyangia bacterium]
MRRSCALAAMFACAALASAARAQSVRGDTFNLQLFRPAVDSKGYVTVDGAGLLGHLDISLGLTGTIAHDVLSLRGANGSSFNVDYLITPELQFALGLFKWAEVGVSLPVSILYGHRGPTYKSPDDPNANNDLAFSGQFVSDIGIHVKGRILNGHRYPVGLAALLSVYVPSATDHQFLGENQVTLRPELIVERDWDRRGRFRTALNAGVLVRPSVHSFTDVGTVIGGDAAVNAGGMFCAPSSSAASPTPMPGDAACGTGLGRALGSQFTYGLGAAFGVVPQKFDLVGELYGYADLTGAAAGHPLEGLLAAKVYLARNSYFEIGGGAGLLPRTVTSAGGMTGSPAWRLFLGFIFEPSIGDRDGDGIKDDVDKCPDEPEDFDDYEDEDGCPDPDNDKDGILDKDDRCPNEPGPIENHGCPVTVKPPEPEPDRDHDGIPDKDDECPEIPGPKENGGCPFLDSDGDGILDKDDHCPHEWGPKENFGCPLPHKSMIRKGQIITMNPIYFETAKAIIKPISYPTLDDVADTLKSNQQLLIVEIQGHADERGDDDYNMRLTEDRAAAVKTYLIGKGVAADRLQSHGYGETKPLCRQHAESCWSKNRRVEFVILRRSDNPLPGE